MAASGASTYYLPEKTSMGALIAAVIGEEVTYRGLRASPSPHQPKVPMELLRFCYHGLQKDPDERHASAKCMIKALQRILEGRLDVRCAATLQKRALREAARVVDKRPRLTLLVFMGLFAALIWSGIELVRRAIT